MIYILNIFKSKSFLKYLLWILAVTTIYSLCVNIPLIKMNYPQKYFLLAFLMSITRNYIIWLLASLNKYVFAIFSLFSCIAGCGLKYVNEYLNMGLNIGTFEVIFSTNFVEAKGVMNSTLVFYFVIGATISFIFIFIRFKYIKKSLISEKFLLIGIALILLIIGKAPEKFMKTHKFGSSAKNIVNVGRGFDIMPEKIYENLYHLIRNKIKVNKMVATRKSLEISDIKYSGSNEKVVILVITDALRPDHMSLKDINNGGYYRDTTPYMREKGFILFNDMYACETSTTRSVPCLLTSMNRREHYLSYLSKPSIFTVFKKAGFYTAFISAQSSISTSDNGQKIVADDADYSFFNVNFDVDYDMDLLPYVDNILQNDNPNQLIVVQLNGSHWDYNMRFNKDEAVWTPLCNGFALDCPINNLINSYDNSILATDKFMKNLVEKVQDKNAIIYFTSDHGEYLGEGGLRLHAQDRLNFREVGVVPFALYLSEKAKKEVDSQIIINNKDKITTSDVIFHSISSCSGIETDIIDISKSICSSQLFSVPDEFVNYISNPVE